MALLKMAGPTSKVGYRVPQFNLPAMYTCPGSTSACRDICYATDGFHQRRLVKRLYSEALHASLRSDFVATISDELRNLRAGQPIRLHSSGDFYSVKYAVKWLAACRAFPGLRFWAYTRSWRVPGFEPVLRELAALPNVQLFASVDDETGPPPDWLRHAVIVDSFDDLPADTIACLYQRNSDISCARCAYCFQPSKRKQHVAFVAH